MSKKLFDSVTNIKKDKLIVISVAIIAVILVLVYLFDSGEQIDGANNPNKFVLSETGEASDINMSIPSINQKQDTSLLDAYKSVKRDSLQELRRREEGLGMGANTMLFEPTVLKKVVDEDEERRKMEEELGISSNKSRRRTESSLGNPTTPIVPESKAKNSHNVYGDYSMWNTNNSAKSDKSKSVSKKKIEDTDAQEWEDEEEEQADVERLERKQRALDLAKGTTSSSKKNNSSLKSKSKGKSFEDLPETEQRRLMLQTGGKYEESESIKAKIMSTGTIKNGQTVRIITEETANLNYNVIPSGTIIAGIVNFSENRMNIKFSTIRLKNKIIKVNLVVYSMDGLEGFAVDSENFTEDVENEGISEAVKATGRVGRIVGSVISSKKRAREISVDLGRDVRCILVNKNLEE